MCEQVKAKCTGLRRWIVLWFGLGLGFTYVLLQRAVPLYPYNDHDQIIYPLLFIVHNKISQFAIYVILMVVIILGIVRAKLTGIQLLILGGLLIFLSLYVIAIFLFVPSFTHIDSARYDQHIYYLAYSEGLDPEGNFSFYAYIVYECDNLGLICTNIDTPYRDIISPTYSYMRLFMQDNILFSRLDDELRAVPVNNASE